jgi:transcriptional regulator with XRE-family HTH domain
MVTKTQVRLTRKRLGESQADFAKHFKVNQSTIHRWETGKLPIEGIIEIGVEAVLARLAYIFVEQQAAE